jgi:hypothetical protein
MRDVQNELTEEWKQEGITYCNPDGMSSFPRSPHTTESYLQQPPSLMRPLLTTVLHPSNHAPWVRIRYLKLMETPTKQGEITG